MKNLSIIILILSLLIGSVSCKKDIQNPSQSDPIVIKINQHIDSLNNLQKTVQGQWQIQSITVQPAINGSTTVAIDPADKYTLLQVQGFLLTNSESYSLGAGKQGSLVEDFQAIPYNGFPRKDFLTTTYTLNTSPNTISWLDEAKLTQPATYTIVSASSSTLVLTKTTGQYTYTKTFVVGKPF